MSSDVRDAIDKLLDCGVVNRHSYFQLKYFVVGKEPTTQTKMWRCIRELEARRDSLNAMDAELLETKDNIEVENIEIERLSISKNDSAVFGADVNMRVKELNIKEIDIAIRKRERRKKSLEASLVSIEKKRKETEEEAVFFLKAFESLQKVEQLKPYDDLQEQTKYWNEKLTQLTNLKVLLHLPLDTELVQTIMSLSDDCTIKNEVAGLLEKERLLIERKNQ